MNPIFNDRVKNYFPDRHEEFLDRMSQPLTHGFFLNTAKADKTVIMPLMDFPYEKTDLSESSYRHHNDNIGKTKAYELGLIYPQEIAASLSASAPNIGKSILAVDLCAAPGGKSINLYNRMDKDSLLICNEIDYKRCLTLSSNLERMGMDRCIITNKKTSDLADLLEGCCDIVILDAPCSGEGMIRKYPEILENYSLNNIFSLASLQAELLEDAYRMLKKDGQLVYSTCTFAFEEDEDNVRNFLKKHSDMELISLPMANNPFLDGTMKYSFLDDTEGQFVALMVKKSETSAKKLKYKKTVKEKTVEDFIRENLDLKEYFLYKNSDRYYLSLYPLYDLGNNTVRLGTYIGEVVNKRFEPSHALYRSISLRSHFRFVYELNDAEYESVVSGSEIAVDLKDAYYLLTYHNVSLGFGKAAKGRLKNKYPKGLRRMI